MEVEVLDRQRRYRVGRKGLLAFARRLAAACPPPPGTAGFSVVLVGDRTMRSLNRAWRGKNAATDVLSFPAGNGGPAGVERPLGDIVISAARASEQARAAGYSLARELRILLLHGYLHLLGHDHEVDGGVMLRMQRRLERRLLPLRHGRSR